MAEQFKSNGSVDTSFGTSGVAIADFGILETDTLTSILPVQSTGKIILGGEYTGQGHFGPRLARLNSKGSVDSSFHQGSDTFNQSVSGVKVALEYNDKIIVAGGNGTSKAFVVERYTSSGAIDTAFNGTGHVVTTFSKLSASVGGVVVQPNGSIVVAGTVGGDMEVLRFLSTGLPDSGVSASPQEASSRLDRHRAGTAVALESSGRILVAGSKGNSLAVVRLLGDHTVLSAGQSMVTTGTTLAEVPGLNGIIVADEEPIFSFGTGAAQVSGGVTEFVVEEAGTHTLDFCYQVSTDGGSFGSITSDDPL